MYVNLSKEHNNMNLPLQLDQQMYHSFQPIYHLPNGTCYGYEALLRSKHYGPLTLFKFAEKKGEKHLLDLFSIKQAITTFSQSAKVNDSVLFINIFPSTLFFSSCTYYLYDFIKENPITAHDRIVIEINESESIEDLNRFKEIIHCLKNAGYRIAFGDFDNGCSNLSKITMAEPDFIKLNKWYSHKLSESIEKQNSIKRLVRFCGKEIQIVLEGIETLADLETAQSLGLNFGQGYFLGKPIILNQK